MQALIVVVPCYNEERRFPSADFLEAAERDPTLSFVLVDDGSTDDTLRVLRRIEADGRGQFAVLSMQENFGKAEAVRRGLLYAFAQAPGLVAYMDADLATPVKELEAMRRLFTRQPSLQVVLGSRVALLGREVIRRPSRHYFGRMFASLASMSLGMTVYDTQCGAKVFRNTAAVRSIFAQPFATRWTFDVEILARLKALSREGAVPSLIDSAAECPLRAWRDVSGSKLKALDAMRALVELVGIGIQYRHGWQRRAVPMGTEFVGVTVAPAEVQSRASSVRGVLGERLDQEEGASARPVQARSVAS